ncbi:MAG: S46 family peptidase, partial [Bdellovibrionales bacterium]|nr:S46 family peptidase [Bdellovibrionales bacterium]
LSNAWMKAQKTLNSDTSFNFVTTNDIIGGNSGSPVINKDAEIVGLVFDGNIHSLGGAFGFDESMNRAVSVSSPLLREALDKVYKVKLPFMEK